MKSVSTVTEDSSSWVINPCESANGSELSTVSIAGEAGSRDERNHDNDECAKILNARDARCVNLGNALASLPRL